MIKVQEWIIDRQKRTAGGLEVVPATVSATVQLLDKVVMY